MTFFSHLQTEETPVAIKTCKVNTENDDKGKTEKFLEEACKFQNRIFHCMISSLNRQSDPGDLAPGDHRGARPKVLQNFTGLFERRTSVVLTRQC